MWFANRYKKQSGPAIGQSIGHKSRYTPYPSLHVSTASDTSDAQALVEKQLDNVYYEGTRLCSEANQRNTFLPLIGIPLAEGTRGINSPLHWQHFHSIPAHVKVVFYDY